LALHAKNRETHIHLVSTKEIPAEEWMGGGGGVRVEGDEGGLTGLDEVLDVGLHQLIGARTRAIDVTKEQPQMGRKTDENRRARCAFLSKASS
jgi:hypothetical protein